MLVQRGTAAPALAHFGCSLARCLGREHSRPTVSLDMTKMGIAFLAAWVGLACTSQTQGGPGAGGTGNTGNTGGTGNTGNTGGTGGGTGANAGTCMDIMQCFATCADTDTACPDACYAAGSTDGQNQMLALLNCMDQWQCADVSCIETQCPTQLVTCLDSSTTGGGTTNPGGSVPPGSIPAELVGYWVRPSSDEVYDYTFNADGSASHNNFKNSELGSCSMTVHSEWTTGSVVAQGDVLTVALADGTTSVAWSGGCGSGYTNPAPGKVIHLQYQLDASGLWLTDLDCTGPYCQELYKKN